MKTILAATAATALMTGAALASSHSNTVKMGVMVGFTGPIESLANQIASGAEMAMDEVNEAGGILGGKMMQPMRADTGCIDNGLATSNAERLVAEGVAGIVGGDCSGVTGAILANVAVPNGIVMISPSATSPGLTTAKDNGLFFRTSPSDARQGEIMAELLKERGVKSFAMTYVNNDYGKGLADSIASNAEAMGIEVTISTAHDDGKGDYSSEVAELDAAGGDMLVVAGHVDQGGQGIIRAALDTGAYDTFGLPDGMIGEALIENIGRGLNGSWGQHPSANEEGIAAIKVLGDAAGFDATSPFAPQAYDAAALFALAMEAAGSTDPGRYASKIMDVANAPGQKIGVGELARGLRILRNGGQVNYQGATSVELIGPGESAGLYRHVEVRNGDFQTVDFR